MEMKAWIVTIEKHFFLCTLTPGKHSPMKGTKKSLEDLNFIAIRFLSSHIEK